jgi:sterol desaturase/sphingolipid hydroxylase (fatty acid hydroxylase superfamily)
MSALRRVVVPLGLLLTCGVIALTLCFDGSRKLVVALFPLGCLIALTVLELVAGEARPKSRDAARDAICFLLSVVLGGAAPLLASAGVAALGLPSMEGPGRWPFLLAFPVALLACDLLSYLVHRAFHEVPALWRVHALHHSPRSLYTFVTFVENPLMVAAMRGSRSMLLLLCGFSGDVVFAVAVLDAWLGMSSHLGLATESRWLAWLVATPETHRMHHADDLARAGNFGLLLTAWDRLFGTFVAPTAEPVQVGLAGGGEALPTSWWRLLLLRPVEVTALAPGAEQGQSQRG